jgi:hypothetical protein
MPINPAASSTMPSDQATESMSNPASDAPMPTASEYGIGRLSANIPITGWNTDAQPWNTSVIKPICPKSRCSDNFNIG